MCFKFQSLILVNSNIYLTEYIGGEWRMEFDDRKIVMKCIKILLNILIPFKITIIICFSSILHYYLLLLVEIVLILD